MAGAFSGHLVDSFYAQQARNLVPFGSQSTNLITSGAMSFNPQMHGTPAMGNQSMGDYSFSFHSPHSTFNAELSEATTLKIAALQAKLNQKLGPEYISQRPGPGGGPKLTYAEGWKIINLANEVFGFNGWSSSVVSLTTDFIDYNEESKRYNVGTTAIVRVTLRDGVFHEDIGYGMLENSKSKGAALDKCKKEAVTDGLKRALRNFGNLLGNCLYDKTYTQEVIKIKVTPPKFDQSELHRRPEFEETKPNIASTSKSTLSSASNLKSVNEPASNFVTPTRPAAQTPQQQTANLSSIPSHLRPGVNATGPSRNATTSMNHRSMNPASNAQMPVQGALDARRTHEMTNTRHTVHTPQAETTPAVILPKDVSAGGVNIKPTTLGGSGIHRSAVASVVPQPQPQETEDAADESYHFYSDDDAFLALVDLGEGDLGQPLLPETDLGRPIDGDEDETDGPQTDGDQQVPQTPLSTHAHETRQQPQGQQQAGVLSLLPPQNQRQPQQQSLCSSNQFNPAPKPPPQQAANRDQQQYRPSHNQPPGNRYSNQNQNHQLISAANASAGKRPPTPSIGGFHFPPGMDPRAEQSKQPVPPQGQGLASGIGLKRPLDSMSSSTNMKPGMGASARTTPAGTGQAQVKREVFGRLDIGGGGDVKRVRR